MARIIPPVPGEPRRPFGPRDSGDAWVEGDHGRFWGRYGAAGLLAHDPLKGVLLQHRAEWSDQGGTWGLPGGALHRDEDAVTGALREAHEEAGVPETGLVPQFRSVFSVGYWTYTTVVARVQVPFEPVINDHESIALEWVSEDAVERLPLHPGFEAAWPNLRAMLGHSWSMIVDAANVVGARPDGWWRDRAGAAARLRDALEKLVIAGLSDEDAAHLFWQPAVTLVVEGGARGISNSAHVRVVDAPRAGDDEIVDQVSAHVADRSGERVTVITSDRELRARVEKQGGRVHGSAWLWQHIDAVAGR